MRLKIIETVGLFRLVVFIFFGGVEPQGCIQIAQGTPVNISAQEQYLSVLFNRVSVMTGRTIRNANINLRPPRLNTTLAHNCFAHRGALLWNNLPTEIKSAKSYESFKNRLKKQEHLSVDVNLA